MKIFKVLTTEFALNDLELGRQFYSKNSNELGNYFFDSLITDIESLGFYAGIHLKEDGFYKLLSKRFPYAIYYDLPEKDIVRVVAIFDQRKNPILNYEELHNRI